MHRIMRLAVAGVLATAILGFAAQPALASYGHGSQYQIELSANLSGPAVQSGAPAPGGGVWLWIELGPLDPTTHVGQGDYTGSDCGHGEGAVADSGDVTWHYSGDSVVIEGVLLNGLGGFPTTITVPAGLGHYTGTLGSFMTLPGFIPGNLGFSQLQVAP